MRVLEVSSGAIEFQYGCQTSVFKYNCNVLEFLRIPTDRPRVATGAGGGGPGEGGDSPPPPPCSSVDGTRRELLPGLGLGCVWLTATLRPGLMGAHAGGWACFPPPVHRRAPVSVCPCLCARVCVPVSVLLRRPLG